jgi:hypothetical protein
VEQEVVLVMQGLMLLLLCDLDVMGCLVRRGEVELELDVVDEQGV